MIDKAWTHLPGQDKTEGGKYEIGNTGIRVMSDQYEKQVDQQLDSIKHQLINTAHELSSLADLKLEPNGVGVAFRACTDQGHVPYRGVISSGFIHARKGLLGRILRKTTTITNRDY